MHYLAESRSLAILAEIRGRQWAERVLAVRQGTLTSDPGHSSYDDSTWETMHSFSHPPYLYKITRTGVVATDYPTTETNVVIS